MPAENYKSLPFGRLKHTIGGERVLDNDDFYEDDKHGRCAHCVKL